MDAEAIAAEQLAGLDPYDLLDAEAARIDAFVSGLDDAGWAAPTRCADWDRRQLMAHLAATEEYHHACLDDTLGSLLERTAATGATDLHTYNAMGVREREGRTAAEVVEEWRQADARTRSEMRRRDGGDMATMVGPYPVRWQAFHVASELATHADDLGVPVTPEEGPERTAWRDRFSRFALAEAKPDQNLDVGDLSAEELVEGVAGRLPSDHPRASQLSTVP